MLRLVGAFAMLLLGPLVLLLFPSQTLVILFMTALIGGAGLVVFTLAQVGRAYVRYVRRRVRRSTGHGPVWRGLAMAAWLVAGAVASVLILPAYLVHSTIGGMLDGGASSTGGGGRDVIPLTGFVALAIVAFLILIAPLVGLLYVGISIGLYWLHRSRIQIDDRPTTIGIGGLIDWLDHQARAST